MTRDEQITLEGHLASARSELAEAYFGIPHAGPQTNAAREHADRCRLFIDEALRQLKRSINSTPVTEDPCPHPLTKSE